MGPEDSRKGLTPGAFEVRALGFIALGIVMLGILYCLPPIPQPLSYHLFADDRTMLGVPNFLNVVSNIPFFVVGVLGLWLLLRKDVVGPDRPVLEAAERWPYLAFFAGVLLTAFGSTYYHLAPDNDRLVWDRLPITVAFMGFFAGMIGERMSVRAGAWLLGPLLWLGFVSVLSWHLGERRGAGDLRLCGFVQFYPMLTIPVLIWKFPARYTHAGYVFVALGWYVLAKVLEIHYVDHAFYSAGQLVSGHTLKHLTAAAGAFWIFLMVKYRRPAAPAG